MSSLLEHEEAVDIEEHPLLEGTRIERFVLLRHLEGRSIAVAVGSVVAVSEIDDGALLMLLGGRMVQASQALGTVLAWLDGRG